MGPWDVLSTLFKISSWLTNIFIITINPVTLIPVYDPTFLFIGSLSFGDMRWSLMVFDGSSKISSPKPYIVVPYYQGLSESYKNICKQYGIDVHLKGGQTIKDHLMSPKDKEPINIKKSGVIYRYKCDRVDCDDEYIGESARNFEESWKNISRPHLPYMTIIISLVMMSLLTILPYWGERTKTS